MRSNRHQVCAWALLACATACSNPVEPDTRLAEAGPAVCEAGPLRPAATAGPSQVLGPSSNGIRAFGRYAFIPESGSNTVARLDLETGAMDSPFADLGDGRGPWDVWHGGDELWVTNFVSGTVSVVDAQNGEVVDEIENPGFDGPSGIAGVGDLIYVSSVEFSADGYGPGSVSVIDRASREVLGRRTTERMNPQWIEVIDTTDGPRVVVTDSGILEFVDGRAIAGSEAAVEIWTPTAEPLEPRVQVAVLERRPDERLGNPGRAVAVGERAYFASGTGPYLFSIDVSSGAWLRGSDDPIVLYETDGDALNHVVGGPDGILYVTAFNEDAMVLVDTRCDRPLTGLIELEATSALAGPHGAIAVASGAGVTAWYVASLANELGRVDFDFGTNDE